MDMKYRTILAFLVFAIILPLAGYAGGEQIGSTTSNFSFDRNHDGIDDSISGDGPHYIVGHP